MPGAHYTVGEVVFLLSISRREAIACDADPVSWLGRMSPDGPSHGSAGESPLPVIARWNDVHRARRTVRSQRDDELLRLRLEDELTTGQAGAVLGISERHARRRLKTTVDMIIDELGGLSSDEEFDRATDIVERALKAMRS